MRIQVYVPDSLLDTDNKINGEYLVFDPTGLQAIPAYTNAQRLGIGGPLLDLARVIIQVSNHPHSVPPQKIPEKKNPKGGF